MTSKFTPRTRWIIINRDSDANGTPICQWCGGAVRIDWGEYSIQHRRARGMGGSRLKDTGQPQNGVLVHGSATTGCHSEIERNPTKAAERGFRVAQYKNPAAIPIVTWDGRQLTLTVGGEAIPAERRDG
ncbi:hypothetical protein [Microbacterium sp. YY-01]|uniref:hypothetical protein n=1 Tax=Microbacterium sp. YY-01 TaxID=3421634 RepID=UPI003D16ACD9